MLKCDVAMELPVPDLAEARPLVAWLTRSAKGVDNSTWTRTSDLTGVAAEHRNSGAKLGTTKRDHVLADMDRNLLSLMVVGVHQDPLDEVVAVLIASNVNKWNAWTIRMSSGDDSEVAIQKLRTTNLEALLNNLGSKLINAVAVGVGQDVINNATLVWRRAMLAEMLNAPVAELTMSDKVDVGDDFLDSRTLLLLDAVLKDVLNNQTASLTKSNLMPHAAKSLVDLQHDLRGFTTPTKLEQLLPDVTSIAMNDRIWNAAKKFSDHVSFVILWDRVESLLNDVAAERVHAERQYIAVNGVGDRDNLLGSAMLEAALDKEVAEAVDHQGVCLVDNGLNDLKLLLRSTDLELLLKEDGGLLIVVADYLVHDVLPVAGHSLVKKTAVVHRLERGDIGLTVHSTSREWPGIANALDTGDTEASRRSNRTTNPALIVVLAGKARRTDRRRCQGSTTRRVAPKLSHRISQSWVDSQLASVTSHAKGRVHAHQFVVV